MAEEVYELSGGGNCRKGIFIDLTERICYNRGRL